MLPLKIADSNDGTIQLVPYMEPSERYKFLGVVIAMDGNQEHQLAWMKQKITQKIEIFNQCNFLPSDIHLC